MYPAPWYSNCWRLTHRRSWGLYCPLILLSVFPKYKDTPLCDCWAATKVRKSTSIPCHHLDHRPCSDVTDQCPLHPRSYPGSYVFSFGVFFIPVSLDKFIIIFWSFMTFIIQLVFNDATPWFTHFVGISPKWCCAQHFVTEATQCYFALLPFRGTFITWIRLYLPGFSTLKLISLLQLLSNK